MVLITLPAEFAAVAILISSANTLKRLLVGAHWPSDVLAGLSMGLVLALALSCICGLTKKYILCSTSFNASSTSSGCEVCVS